MQPGSPPTPHHSYTHSTLRDRNNPVDTLVSAAVSLGGMLVVVCIQLATLVAPLAIGLTGAISGGVAGVTSILAWALIGVPASYAFVDLRNAIASSKTRYAVTHVTPIRS